MFKRFSLFYVFCIPVIFATDISKSRETAITKAIKKVGPAVVNINVEGHVSSLAFDPFSIYGFNQYNIPIQGHGSGVLISPDGYVLTNEHVIENAKRITVILSGGDEYFAQLVGKDGTFDLALLKIDGNNFPYAELGDSDQLIIGEWLIAIGSPFDLFSHNHQPSASVGIVSALHMDFGYQKNGKVFQNMIQTDAAINQGNSGGPLVNSIGQVIGINTFIYTGSEYKSGSIGIGFAIPINSARQIAEELREKGYIERKYYTGLAAVQPLTKRNARFFNFSSALNGGVIIVKVHAGSPASKAGLQAKDVIISANGRKVYDEEDIRGVILENNLRAGDILNLRIYRNGKKRKVQLRLGKYKRK